MKLPRIAIPALLAACTLNAATPPGGGHDAESFDAGWTFSRYGLQGDGTKRPEPANMEAPEFDASAWRKLDLPHDFGIEGPFRYDLSGSTGKLPWRGIGWYRKKFTVPASDAGKRTYLDLDGAMSDAKVYCNGQYAGGWPYGYASFRVDLTPFLKPGAENVVAVRTDTEKCDSRWYPGAGIYRHVWLVKTSPVHVAQWGVFVTTPEISADKAKVNLAVTVENHAGAAATATLETDIFELGADGKPGAKVASCASANLTVAEGKESSASLTAEIASPKLWSTTSPSRYLARTVVKIGGAAVDTYDTPFGVRTIKATAHDGFLLNGKRIEIKGVCNHHDLGALGAALNDSALERQLVKLRDMGCNAIRTSHNPPAPELLELADRMGFLVWDETFDCWAKGKGKNDYSRFFKEWSERDTVALAHRDRNHPSVIIWSIGNEVHEQQDVELTKHLADIMRAEDPTRPISRADNSPDKARASGAVLSLDIMGINYFFNQQAKWDADPRYKNMPTIGSETSSAISSRGVYLFGRKRADWQCDADDVVNWGKSPDDQFRINAKYPHLLGEFVWTGFDYLGEPTPYGSGDATQLLNFRDDPTKRAQLEKELAELAKKVSPSRSSYFGIIDLAGFPKDRFYSYQAHWRSELPMAHLLPHWTWPERVGQKTPVQLFTSGDEAELFVNGVSQGRLKKTPGKDFRLVWPEVVYQPGEIKVVAYKDGKEWATDTVKTAGDAAKLTLAPERTAIRTDGKDLAYVAVRIEDKAGVLAPRANNAVKFTVTGAGAFVAADNGDATSFESFQSPSRKAFNGLAMVIVKATGPGPITVRAESEGLAPSETVLNAK